MLHCQGGAAERRNRGLVITGSAMDAPASGWSVKTVEMVTICPDFCWRICVTTCCVMKKYPATFVLIIISKSSGV